MPETKEIKKQNIVRSFNSAIEGMIYVAKTQRNMRLHFLTAALALLLGIYLNLDKVEVLVLLFAVSLVLFSEMFNTAMEISSDLISHSYNPMVKVIKDIAAGCVLLSSINAFIVGYFLFFSRPWGIYIETGVEKIKASPWHITFVILILVLILVILGKVLFHKGTPLRGGMPSGHAALAFSIWTIISFLTANHLAIVLVLILAALVARSRLVGGIHSVGEVIVGAILGTTITTLIFQILG